MLPVEAYNLFQSMNKTIMMITINVTHVNFSVLCHLKKNRTI